MSGSKTILAHVVERLEIEPNLTQLYLKPDIYIPYQAGQYLQIIQNERALSYSIANAPLEQQYYELHIRHGQDVHNQALMHALQKNAKVTISLPYGFCHWGALAQNSPVIFIAVGTGIAPIKAMLEQAFHQQDDRLLELHWATRSLDKGYIQPLIDSWEMYKNFTYFPRITTSKNNCLTEKVLQRHHQDIKNWQIVISGAFDMVYRARDNLVANGAAPGQLFSDAFAFE